MLDVHLVGKKHIKAMARYRVVNKADKATILRSLPDTGCRASMTHPINHLPSLLPPNTIREGTREECSQEGPSNSFSDVSICDGEDVTPIGSYKEAEVAEVSSCERQCRGFWPPLIPTPQRISNILGFPAPNGQYPPQRLFHPPPQAGPPEAKVV